MDKVLPKVSKSELNRFTRIVADETSVKLLVRSLHAILSNCIIERDNWWRDASLKYKLPLENGKQYTINHSTGQLSTHAPDSTEQDKD